MNVSAAALFRVRDNIHDVISVVQDEEIKPPILIDAGLPNVLALIVFLGAQRRVPQILFQQPHLFEQRLANAGRKEMQRLAGPRGAVGLHRERLALGAIGLFLTCAFMWAIISSASRNGPKVRPALMSASPSASRAS